MDLIVPFQILDIIPGGPCHSTNMLCGDVLTHIDGIHLNGRTGSEILQFTMGNEGSTANLTVKRGATKVISSVRLRT
jgi:C-terminal processing protease CtpA/Prc